MAISEQMQARRDKRDKIFRHVREMNAALALIAEITLRPEIAREVCMEVAALVQEAERVFQRAMAFKA